MADIIQLLPDSIANQIAAGEVIQRPASVVKELMENSVDAGATEIHLVLKDSGKTLIRVVDNGKGMSVTDARMSFERHATSKIKSAEDLFKINSKGFRGEALASIAAIAHVEMITRRAEDELANVINIEGSELKKQDVSSANPGTSISVRNIFFNVPARRKFLKSDSVELKHIIDEFVRLALSHQDVFFTLHHNGNELYHLPAGNERQRIVGVFGKSINEKLVPISEETDFLTIKGFIGKAEAAKKTRGDQYIFVNNRFIKSNYLNHAIKTAYEELIPKDHFPFYTIFLGIPTEMVDINVHPTKQEIKFENERLIYNYIKVACRHALGQYNIIPSLDFDAEDAFLRATQSRPVDAQSPSFSAQTNIPKRPDAKDVDVWNDMFKSMAQPTEELEQPVTIESRWGGDQSSNELISSHQDHKAPYQIHKSWLVCQIKSGFLLIDQQSAHERVLYEKYLHAMNSETPLTQKQLFAKTIEFDTAKSELLTQLLDQINELGFEIESFGKNSFVIHGMPAGLSSAINETELIEGLLTNYLDNLELQLGIQENIARSLAAAGAIKRGQTLNEMEMQSLIDQLFACEMPYKNPFGRHCFISYDIEELKKQFTA